MNLYLRKVIHLQTHDNYRVILKRDSDEFEIGSIGIQHGAAWAWGIDTVIPMRAHETQRGRQRSQGLYAAVQGCLGAICCRRGQRGVDTISVDYWETSSFLPSLAMMVPYFIRQTRYLPSSSLRPVNFILLFVFW